MNLTRLAEIKSIHEKTLAASRAEKTATFYLLECLHAVEKTGAHIELSYPTLFEYVHRALGYSESQSYERIAAMRLAFKVPEVSAALKGGELTLTSVARIASHSKREKLGPPAIAALAQRSANKSVREVEKVLAAEATVELPARETIKPVSKTTATLTITIDAEFEALLKEARELEAAPGVPVADILKKALKARVEKKRKQRGFVHADSGDRSDGARAVARGVNIDAAAKVAVNSKKSNIQLARRYPSSQNTSRYVAVGSKQVLSTRSEGQCEWISPVTGVRCQSLQSIQVDHVVPWRLGGTSEISNLQHLCAVHNRAKGMG